VTPEELAVIRAQQELRAELEELCQQHNWSLDEVFYSDIEFHADPDRIDYNWPSTWPTTVERPNWATDATRQKPVIAPLHLSRRRSP
jgi:hypothetical protein